MNETVILAMRFTDRKFGIILLMPAALLVALLFVYPIAYSFYMSFHEKDPFSTDTAPYVGLDNFKMALEDPAFWIAFKNGLIYGCTTVFFQVVVGISLSLLLNAAFAGRSVARGLILAPYIIPGVAVALIWRWMFNDFLGIVNRGLSFLGIINEPIAWFGDPNWAMIGVTIVGVWRYFPFVIIAVLARLQTIPEALYDAATVDGANAFQRFKDITIPQLRYVLFVVVLLRFLWMFNDFETIWLLTSGGPVNKTLTLPILVYITSFKKFELSLALSITVLMTIFLVLMAVVFFRIYRVEEDIE